MSRQAILLIAHDQLLALRLVQTFATYGLPSPTQVGGADEAIGWLEQQHFAVCLLDFDIPDGDGLQALARLHQREPGLPIIVLSSAGSEAVAVDAFRAGVRDYIPKRAGFEESLAQQLRILLHLDSTGRLPQPIVVGPDVPNALRLPTYQNRMRVIGRELDVSEFRSVCLWEVSGGFLARGFRSGQRTPEALEFPDRDFQQLVAVTARGDGHRRLRREALLPTGYEDLLRAIGGRLDRTLAESVTVTELSHEIVISGLARLDGAGHATPLPFEWILDVEETVNLLDEAYRQRTESPPPEPGLLRRVEG